MKRILPFLVAATALSLGAFLTGCSGEEKVDDAAITEQVNKDLEGMPVSDDSDIATGSPKRNGK
jgi:hypothetical protein